MSAESCKWLLPLQRFHKVEKKGLPKSKKILLKISVWNAETQHLYAQGSRVIIVVGFWFPHAKENTHKRQQNQMSTTRVHVKSSENICKQQWRRSGKRKLGMKLSLPSKLVEKLVWVRVILFCKISIPVPHVMPYYAKPWRSHPLIIWLLMFQARYMAQFLLMLFKDYASLNNLALVNQHPPAQPFTGCLLMTQLWMNFNWVNNI
jgi:hypothetical protein